MRTLLISGLLVLGVSAPPLLLMAREAAVSRSVSARYTVERIISTAPGIHDSSLEAEIGGHRVQLLDEYPIKARVPFEDESLTRPGTVRIVVDGKVRSTPVAATVRVNKRDANRYWGFSYLQRLHDRDGTESLVVAQRLGGNRYRTVSVFADGNVVEDEFGYADRCELPVRAILIRNVVPHPSGYCSDVLQVWPSIFYPVLYPWVSGLLGGAFVGVALVAGYFRRRSVTTREKDA
jgi:hypothetical protein